MLHVQGVTASLLHPAASHLLPGTVMVLGALLIYKVATRKSRQRTQERQQAEDKQSELEQKLENLQTQYDSLKKTEQAAQQKLESTKTNNVTSAATPPTAGKYTLFDKIIKENMAIREAANA